MRAAMAARRHYHSSARTRRPGGVDEAMGAARGEHLLQESDIPVLQHVGANGVTAARQVASMPYCLIHALPRVRSYFLMAGVESAMDVANWWACPKEAEERAATSGWDHNELLSALLAWNESQRPAIQGRANVPVPSAEVAAAGQMVPPSALPSRISVETLVPGLPQWQIQGDHHHAELRSLFMKAGPLSQHWDATDPAGVAELLLRKAGRTDRRTVRNYLAGWRRWVKWLSKRPDGDGTSVDVPAQGSRTRSLPW